MSDFNEHKAIAQDAEALRLERERWAQVLARPELPRGYRRARREKPQPTKLFIFVMVASLAAFVGAIVQHIAFYYY